MVKSSLFAWALRTSYPRPTYARAAEQRDEIAAFQLVELHSISASQRRMQDIESAMVSQERIYDLSSVATATPRGQSSTAAVQPSVGRSS
jgi:hypothetical protein